MFRPELLKNHLTRLRRRLRVSLGFIPWGELADGLAFATLVCVSLLLFHCGGVF
jgi:hypothetical protein